MIPTFYTPAEVAEMFKVKPLTIYRWIKEGRLKATKIGQWKIAQSDIEDMLRLIHGKKLPDLPDEQK